MRILMLSWEYPPHLIGGLGTHVAALVPALAERGVEVVLLTPRLAGGPAHERVGEHAAVYRVEPPVARLGNYYADVQQTNLALEEFGQRLWEQYGSFDLVHAHDWLVGFAAEAFKRLHKTPLVVTMHATERGRARGLVTNDMGRAIDGAEWWLTYEAWRVITTSHFMAHELQTFFQLPADKISVIPNGIDCARFDAFNASDLQAFRSLWAQADEPIIYYVGRIQYEKGVQFLVEAAPRVLEQEPRAKFILAGTGELLDSLRQRVMQLGLAQRVILPGFVSDETRDRLYKVANVAVFPSLYEPFGIVALEAMAACCPVIVSNVGGLSEVVIDGLTGRTFPAGNIEALADTILNTLRQTYAAQERAERAFAVVCRMYTWQHVAEETRNLYARVIRERAHVVWE